MRSGVSLHLIKLQALFHHGLVVLVASLFKFLSEGDLEGEHLGSDIYGSRDLRECRPTSRLDQ